MKHPENLTCNIIKDLLPSYMDGICTPDTKTAVDYHLSTCSDCRNLITMIQETEIISERTDFSEINYMKKIKNHFIKKGSYTGIFLAIFILLGYFISINNYHFTNVKRFYILLPFLLAITRLLFPSALPPQKCGRIWKNLTITGIFLTGYGILLNLFLLLYMDTWIAQGFGPFHVRCEWLGPFLDYQLYAILAYLIIIYLFGLYRAIYDKPFHFLYMNIYLTCGFITLSQSLTLKVLTDSSEALPNLIRIIIILSLEGIAGEVLSLILQKKSCR